MQSIGEAGQAIMRPIQTQLAQGLDTPAPQAQSTPEVPMPEPSLATVKPWSLGSLEDWGFGAVKRPEPLAAPEPEPAAQSASATVAAPKPRGAFELPGIEAWGFLPQHPTGPAGMAGSAQAEPAPRQGAPGRLGAQAAPTDVNAYLKHAALKAGIDPGQVLAVMGKEGPTGWGSVGTFDTGTSYGPLQLHYAGGSNPKAGMGDRFTKATGIDLRKDSSIQAHQAAVDFAMGELLKRGDWSEWYGADNAFPAAAGGKGRFTPITRVEPTPQAPAATAQSAGPPAFGTYRAEDLTPNQVTEGTAQGLSAEEALAVCGPAAAVAFSRANGRNPTLREAKELASNLGLWDVGAGMHGPASQVSLLEKMGVPARLAQGADWNAIRAEVQAGRPVIADSPQHYYVISDVRDTPNGPEYQLGASAGVLKSAGGKTWWRADQIPSLGMGDIRATIFMGRGQ